MMRKFGTAIFSVLPFINRPQTHLALKWQLEKGKQEVKADKNAHNVAKNLQQTQHQERSRHGG